MDEFVASFGNKAVRAWDSRSGLQDPKRYAYRVGIATLNDEQTQWFSIFNDLLQDPAAPFLESLVIGDWHTLDEDGGATPVIAALVASRARLSRLRHLFLGDIVTRQFPPQWIEQGDISPLFDAYPNLETLHVRGTLGLRIDSPRHARLQQLIIEGGGLRPQVLRALLAAHLPALRKLELWLGAATWLEEGQLIQGVAVDDLLPLLRGDAFPALRHLGLRNSELADEIALAASSAPILQRLETLDLSLGTLSDRGAQSLIDGLRVSPLSRLDIHHHYCSGPVLAQLRSLDIVIDDSVRLSEDSVTGYRLVALSL